MVRSMQVITFKVVSTDKVATLGRMDQNTLEAGKRIKSMAKAFISGLMVVAMRVIGKTTICMVMESTHGKTEENMMDNTSKTESMDSEFILGQMDDSMKDNGRTVASTVKATTGSMQALSHVVEYGLKARGNAGSTNSNETKFKLILEAVESFSWSK